jgi:hypothetical protein
MKCEHNRQAYYVRGVRVIGMNCIPCITRELTLVRSN